MSWQTVMNAAEAAKNIMLSDRRAGERKFALLIRKNPGDGMIYYHFGLAYESLGEHTLAEANLKKAFDLFPKTEWKNNAREALERVGRAAQHTSTASSQQSAAQAASQMLLFISHSSKDADTVLALIELVRAALGLRDEQIRCTSIDGFRLPAGIHTDEHLRLEAHSAKTFIALITPQSYSSTYVLFELGARWGANLPLIVLLAEVEPHALEGPLRAFNALSCANVSQLHQLVHDLAKSLQLLPQSPASYSRYVDNLMQKTQQVRDAASSRKVTSKRKTIGELDTVSTNQGVLAMLRPFRALAKNEYYVSEEPSRSFQGSLKFWRKNPQGRAEVAFALNVSGNIRKTPHGQLDLWITPNRFANILDISKAQAAKLLRALPLLELKPNRCIIRLRTVKDADKVAHQLQSWFEKYPGFYRQKRSH